MTLVNRQAWYKPLPFLEDKRLIDVTVPLRKQIDDSWDSVDYVRLYEVVVIRAVLYDSNCDLTVYKKDGKVQGLTPIKAWSAIQILLEAIDEHEATALLL